MTINPNYMIAIFKDVLPSDIIKYEILPKYYKLMHMESFKPTIEAIEMMTHDFDEENRHTIYNNNEKKIRQYIKYGDCIESLKKITTEQPTHEYYVSFSFPICINGSKTRIKVYEEYQYLNRYTYIKESLKRIFF